MAVPRIWIEAHQLADGVSGEAYHHLIRVLRLRSGDPARVVCGDGFEYEVRLGEVTSLQLTLQVVERRPLISEPPFSVKLYLGMLKGEQMDAVIQKAVEVGVTAIVPMETERSQVRLSTARPHRWEKIAQQAAAQAGRARVPDVPSPARLSAILAEARPGLSVMFWEGTRSLRLRDVAATGPISLFVGPEGGFSAAEASAAEAAGLHLCTLGPRILRASTAAVVAVTLAMYELGEM